MVRVQNSAGEGFAEPVGLGVAMLGAGASGESVGVAVGACVSEVTGVSVGCKEGVGVFRISITTGSSFGGSQNCHIKTPSTRKRAAKMTAHSMSFFLFKVFLLF